MNRYAIIESGSVVNIAVSEQPLGINWIICLAEVQLGWKYDGSTFTKPLVYGLADKSITGNGVALPEFSGNHYCPKGAALVVSAKVVDDAGNVVSSISLPVAVKLPLIRHADGAPTVDEVYLDTTIVNGVITATGDADRSGDWKLVISRVNEAIKRIGYQWIIDSADITVLV